MPSPLRAASAAVLTFALVALPLALDRCSAFCETHHGAAAATPSCHHTTSTAIRIGHAPPPCSHDHNAMSARMSAGFVKPERACQSAIAVPVAPADTLHVSRQFVFSRRSPDKISTPHDHSVPLRI